MRTGIECRTALLATALGASLFTADAMAQSTGTLDARTARELVVLSRVLEKRLGEMRKSIAGMATASAGTSQVPTGG